jgi:hypothetical protein
MKTQAQQGSFSQSKSKICLKYITKYGIEILSSFILKLKMSNRCNSIFNIATQSILVLI